jgi:hypothetical protein
MIITTVQKYPITTIFLPWPCISVRPNRAPPDAVINGGRLYKQSKPGDIRGKHFSSGQGAKYDSERVSEVAISYVNVSEA